MANSTIQQQSIATISGKSRAKNTLDQYGGSMKAFNRFIESAEIDYNGNREKITDIDRICPLLVAGIVAFLQFASNNSTLRPGTLEGKRSAISKYYRDKGYSDDCFLDADGRIVGNPTRHIAVKSFLDGYESDFWSRNERKDERCEPLLLQDIQSMFSNIRKSIIPLFAKTYLQLFISLAVNGFMRINECITLKFADVSLKDDSDGIKYLKVELRNRKNQKYHMLPIYDRQDELEIQCVRLYKEYVDLLFKAGVPMAPSDFLFPSINSKFQLNTKQSVDYNRIRSWIALQITEWSFLHPSGSFFATHSLRRGGCVHRLNFAKVRWNLNDCKDWGGWADEEQPETLIKYCVSWCNVASDSLLRMMNPKYDYTKESSHHPGDSHSNTSNSSQLASSITTLQVQMNSNSLILNELFEMIKDQKMNNNNTTHTNSNSNYTNNNINNNNNSNLH